MSILNILSIFNFKESLQEVFNGNNVSAFKAEIKKAILDKVKEAIPGQEKMDQVVEEITEWVEDHIHSNNKIVQWIIDVLIINNIRPIIQSIYDDLKEFVEGL